MAYYKTPAVTNPLGRAVQYRLLQFIIVVVSLGCSVKHRLPVAGVTLSPHRCQSTVGTCSEYKGWHRDRTLPARVTTCSRYSGYSTEQWPKYRTNTGLQYRTVAYSTGEQISSQKASSRVRGRSCITCLRAGILDPQSNCVSRNISFPFPAVMHG